MNREAIAYYAYRYAGNWDKIAAAVKREERPEPVRIPEPYITIADAAYPARLRQLDCPPWVLFFRGRIELLQKPMITVVGSRKLTGYGRYLTEYCSTLLAKRYVLVSGMAKGADACVHRTALKEGSTIGVIGSGLDHCYPAENRDLYRAMKQDHLVLSEYPHFVPVRKEHFPWRNRILAALGSCVVVTQAENRSGTMITVNEALALGRDVCCFPWPFEDPCGAGCDRLIQEGAQVIWSREQIMEL